MPYVLLHPLHKRNKGESNTLRATINRYCYEFKNITKYNDPAVKS